MPNNYNFDKLNDVKEIQVNPNGWINPIIIEYGIGYHGEVISYFWRVKDTIHTFVIPIIRMDYLTDGKFNDHFEEVLGGFREDYKKWAQEGWQRDWMCEYEKIFSKLIKL